MIVITGAAGFIGKHLTRHVLSQTSEQIVCLDNLSRGNWNGLRSSTQLSLVTGDVNDMDGLKNLFSKARLVFHLAAQSNVMGAVADIELSFSSNVVGTFNVFRAAHLSGVKHVVFVSSREVYGEPKELPVSENAELLPRNAYGARKLAGEAYARIFNSTEMQVSILRLVNVYGEGDKNRVIPIFIEQALRNLPLTLYGGQQIIDFVPINLVMQALWLVADHPLEKPVNIGSGKGTSLRELAERVVSLTGSQSSIETVPSRTVEVVRFVANIERMRVLLKIEPPDDPLIYLADLVAQCKRNG